MMSPVTMSLSVLFMIGPMIQLDIGNANAKVLIPQTPNTVSPHPTGVTAEHPGLITVIMVLLDWKQIKAAALIVKIHRLDRATPEYHAVITMTVFFLNGMILLESS